ncbi:hypothetical protein D6851_07530 [Altericroceibacterium spongiae]|uniref:Uncharacterized protein n=1 Tax=Altericroceibacterium spongiae TaxID=2320269 RepID=A0A420EMB2_9SPHN|nr:hypothetical protein [Altericroceibacterium spongiae]RKF21857.1 hypothetical protein D6851_07530 [Altericroceibacterium spongiae]
MNKRSFSLTLPLALPLLMLGACVPQVEPPAPAPTPAPAPAPPPPSSTPIPQPPPRQTTYDNWMDAPQTPGDWSYRQSGTGSVASFGENPSAPVFSLRCDRASETVSLIRAGQAGTAVPMQIQTETAQKSFRAAPVADGLQARLAARDPFLDAMAFSKGRFAVGVSGLPQLFIPAWPEVTRVIEDCR